ncbi:MAG: transposase [Planctomycetaceae bacterium]
MLIRRRLAVAIGCVDETGMTKSGSETAGVKRQYNGNRGKIENCVNHVALLYSAPGFAGAFDSALTTCQTDLMPSGSRPLLLAPEAERSTSVLTVLKGSPCRVSLIATCCSAFWLCRWTSSPATRWSTACRRGC